MQRRLDGEERAGSFALLLSVITRVVGALGLLDVLLSVGGQSFVAPFSTAPQGQCCVSSLLGCRGWASWWAQTQVCGDGAVVVEDKRQSVDDLPPSRRPVPLFGGWWWCLRSRFSRDGPHGAHLGPTARRRGKRQFEVQRRSNVSKERLSPD